MPVTSKPARAPMRREQRDVAPTLVAEVEVVAHHHGPGPQRRDQHLVDEVLGRLLRPGLVEVDDQRAVDARWRPAAPASGRGR